MKHFLGILSLLANIITIGGLVYKMLLDIDYNFFSQFLWIIIVIAIQIAFYFLLDLADEFEESKYIAVLYALLIPIILIAAYYGFHQNVSNSNWKFMDVIGEVFKILVISATTVGLLLFWAIHTDAKFYKKRLFISLAYGLPCLLITVLGAYRYLFDGVELDVYFIGYLLLILSNPLYAAVSKNF